MIPKLPFLDASDDANSYFGWAYRDEDLLEYMVEVADHFYPSVDPDSCDLVVCEDGKKRYGKRTFQLIPSTHPNIFGNRFGEGKIDGNRRSSNIGLYHRTDF